VKAATQSTSSLSLQDRIYTIGVYNIQSSEVEQEYQFYGSQSLSKLKEVIYCIRDRINEYQESPNSDSIQKPQQTEPLSFFFIHDRLYIHPSRDILSPGDEEQIKSLEKYINQTECTFLCLFLSSSRS
jgi:hypothetical protein